MRLSLNLWILVFTTSLHAGEAPYSIPITRDGVTHTMLAYNFWSREYPDPVIDVRPNKKNEVKVMGYSSLRNLDKKKSCTIKAGLYHPWSKDKISLINYYSIIPKKSYIAKKRTVMDGKKVKKGEKFKEEIYLSEGFCTYRTKDKERLEANCIGKSPEFKRINYPTHHAEQWLYLRCKEGYKVFVQDRDLLSQPNIGKGEISGYGEVTTKKMKTTQH